MVGYTEWAIFSSIKPVRLQVLVVVVSGLPSRSWSKRNMAINVVPRGELDFWPYPFYKVEKNHSFIDFIVSNKHQKPKKYYKHYYNLYILTDIYF